MLYFADEPRLLQSDVADSARVYDLLVPADHELRLVKALVDFTFLRDVARDCYSPDTGRHSLDPALFGMISFLQYRYTLSDREVVDACQQRLDFKFFLGLRVEDEAPCEHSVLSTTRTLWGEERMKAYFDGILLQCKERKLYKGRLALVDSAKTVANAGILAAVPLIRSVTDMGLDALEAVCTTQQVADLQAESQSLREDTSWWLSSELKGKYLLRYAVHAQQLLERVEGVLAAPGPAAGLANWEKVKARLELAAEVIRKKLEDDRPHKKSERKDRLVNPTDKDARTAATSKGKAKVKAGYKTHMMVDDDSDLITAVEATPMNVEDGTQLQALLEQYQEREGELPKQLAADTAYADGENRRVLGEGEVEAFIPEPAPKARQDGKFAAHEFAYDAEAKRLTCPGGNASTRYTDQGAKKGWNYYFTREVCANCPLKERCLGGGELDGGVKHGKTVFVSYYRCLHDKARVKSKTDAHRQAMKKRLHIERKLAEALVHRGMRRARYRGTWRVRIQAYLTATSLNITTMVKLLMCKDPSPEDTRAVLCPA